jgi:predicted DsbA family dithiol-disulfide isomerase
MNARPRPGKEDRNAQGVVLDVWGDLVCPYCYIAEHSLARALERFAHRTSVVVRWHTYRAYTGGRPITWIEGFMRRLGLTRTEALGRLRAIEALAAASGVEIDFTTSTPTDSFDANRLAHYADACGKRSATVLAIQHALFAQGARINDHDTLAHIASGAGLDGDAVRSLLERGTYGDAVDRDQSEGEALGLTGIPFFRFDDGTTLTGLRSVETLHEALQRAWIDSAPAMGRR